MPNLYDFFTNLSSNITGQLNGDESNLLNSIYKLAGLEFFNKTPITGSSTPLGSVEKALGLNFSNLPKPSTSGDALEQVPITDESGFGGGFLSNEGTVDMVNLGLNIANSLMTGILGEKKLYGGAKGNITKTMDTAYDTISLVAGLFGPYGKLVLMGMGANKLLGGIANKITGGTDGMTTLDAILGSSFFTLSPLGIINSSFAKAADTLTLDLDVKEQIGGSYGGTTSDIEDYVSNISGKRFGLLSRGALHKANRERFNLNRQLQIMTDIADNSRDRFAIRDSMSSINGNRKAFELLGGLDISQLLMGRSGMVLSKKSEATTLGEIELISEFKKGGKVSSIIEIEINTVNSFLTGGKVASAVKELLLSSPLTEILLQSKDLYNEDRPEASIQYAISRFPILKKLGTINLQYDPKFEPGLEYIASEYDTVPYYNDYPKNKDFLGESVIVFNDHKIPNEAIALDWISHGLREYDKKWNKILKKLENSEVWNDKVYDEAFGKYLDRIKISQEVFASLPYSKKKKLEEKFNKLFDRELYNSELDSLIRSLLVKPEYRELLKYAPIEELQPLLDSEEWKEAYNYLFPPAKFKEGGSINIIPEGALHARLHHMDNAENLTKKGIPVVSEENGKLELHAEIERAEIILRLSLTKRLEELAKEGTDEAAIEAGKILVLEILGNTIDNTNNIL